MGDPLLLGDAQLRVARVIVVEPDRGAGFMSFAPRVMVNEADLPATPPDPAGQPRRAIASPWRGRTGRSAPSSNGRWRK